MITPFPEAESPALERFALQARHDVAALLRELLDRQTLVTLYYDDGAGFTVGNVLNVEEAAEAFVLVCAGDGHVQRSITKAADIIVVAFLDSTKIQFRLAEAEAVDFQGCAAFRFDLPKRVLRIQRRTAPRREPGSGRPATCRVPDPAHPEQYQALRVLDISLGGVAVLATPQLFNVCRDQILAPCHLDLPEFGQIGVSLKVRYLDAWPSEVGGHRCGCEFVDLGDGARRTLQRYLDRLQVAKPGANRQAA